MCLAFCLLIVVFVDCGFVLSFTTMGSDCIACCRPVPRDGRFMACAECRHLYHLGQSCSGIADNTFVTMGPAKREKWRCRACRAVGNKSVTEGVAPASQVGAGDFATQLEVVSEKLNLLVSLKASVDSLMQLPAKVDDLLQLRSTVEKIKETVRGVEKSISFFSEKYDSLFALVTSNDKEIRALRTEVNALKSTMTEQADHIDRLQTNANETEQYSRLSNLEIHGHPVSSNENLAVFLSDMAARLNISEFQPSEVLAIHRLPANRGAIPPIIVRFTSVRSKERWMDARKQLRLLPRSESGGRLFFNDNLTRSNKELFWKARNKGRERHYSFVWVRNGRIFAKKNEGSPLVRVNQISDLEKIV